MKNIPKMKFFLLEDGLGVVLFGFWVGFWFCSAWIWAGFEPVFGPVSGWVWVGFWAVDSQFFILERRKALFCLQKRRLLWQGRASRRMC